ncbi:MAG: polysaccharide deacetylase family protein [Deltaproteobacteria bacterium]
MKIFVIKAKNFYSICGLLALCVTALFLGGLVLTNAAQVFTQSSQKLPVYSVETNDKKVSITFDCAWGANDIPNILNTLKQEKVKATFFLVGEWLDKFPNESKAIAAGGHDIGNHSDAHLRMSQLSVNSMQADIANANAKIEKLTGQKCILFRAPYGDFDERLVKVAAGNGQYTIQWDVDSLDWKNISAGNICERVMKKVKNGSIILLHNDTKFTAIALPTLIKNLKNAGYSLVPVSELIYRDNYYMDYTGRQHSKKL